LPGSNNSGAGSSVAYPLGDDVGFIVRRRVGVNVGSDRTFTDDRVAIAMAGGNAAGPGLPTVGLATRLAGLVGVAVSVGVAVGVAVSVDVTIGVAV
jgi:hypothetical protein